MAQDSLTADAFAISPISARAAQPGEADYEAIRDAFMETARGRWFLTEYAKRNRNADTGMVLDAVARIEASVAARGAATPSPAALIAMIRPMIAEARTAAEAALVSPDAAETIAAAKRGVRIIREISWSLRETGTDPRICNILDGQVTAFESVNELAADDLPRELIGEAFDDLVLKLEEIASGIRTAQREAATPPPEPIETVGANLDVADTPVAQKAATPEALTTPDPIAIVEPTPTADEIAADDAVLDLIAMEMSAPEIDDADDFGSNDALADLQSLAQSAPLPAPIMVAPVMPPPVQQPLASPSLGAALIASGIVRARAASEALAPFRRMSQTEKIAFFS